MTSKFIPRLLCVRKIAIPNRQVTPVLLHPPRNHAWKGILSLNLSPPPQRCGFSNTNKPPLLKISSKNLPPRPKPPPEEEIDESFLKGSGPGGQKINKTNSAVQLKHIPTGLVIKCQATRSRSQNRNIARQLLADRLDDMTRGNQSRSSIAGEVKRKKKASSAKKSRRKYRKLEEKGAATGDASEEENGNHIFDEELPEANETEQGQSYSRQGNN